MRLICVLTRPLLISIFIAIKPISLNMTTHFVNLISWRHFLDNKKESIKHLDTCSIVLLARTFGFPVEKVSGVSFFRKHSSSLQSSIFLVAKPAPDFTSSYVLPQWPDSQAISLPLDLKEKLKAHKACVIGISSPKQDVLAQMIQREFPDLEIFCLGAAIYCKRSTSKILERDRFLWIYFLFSSPKRTFLKLYITVLEIFKILFIKKDRVLFTKFLNSIK